MRHLLLAALIGTGPAVASAQTPQVMTDIAPVHSLVAQVMEGVGAPQVLLPPGASPHHFSFRPSDAAALAGADVVIWIGEGLTPWLEEPIAALAEEAVVLELIGTPGWNGLPIREDAAFATAQNEGEDQADHAHDHGQIDPHAWLDPQVAAVWMNEIAATLAAADPEHADLYEANAQKAGIAMQALERDIATALIPLAGRGYLVPHDGYQYFEQRFGLPAAGAIALQDAQSPGPARIAALRDRVEDGGIICILTDADTSPDWTDLLREGGTAQTATIDAIGIDLAPGPALYQMLLRNMAASLTECLGGS